MRAPQPRRRRAREARSTGRIGVHPEHPSIIPVPADRNAARTPLRASQTAERRRNRVRDGGEGGPIGLGRCHVALCGRLQAPLGHRRCASSALLTASQGSDRGRPIEMALSAVHAVIERRGPSRHGPGSAVGVPRPAPADVPRSVPPARRGRPDHLDPAHHVRSDGGGQPGQQLALQGAQLGGPGRGLGLQHQLAVAQLQRRAVLGDVRPDQLRPAARARWRRSAAATSPDRVTAGRPAAPTAVDRGRPGPDRTSGAGARAARRGGAHRRTSDSRTDRPSAARRPPGPRAGLPGRCRPPANRPAHAHRPVHELSPGLGTTGG